jgi:putative peptidoglycan lipid II flippase
VAARSRQSLATAETLHLPSTVALVAFAPVAVAGLYQMLPGRFGAAEVALVAAVVAVYACGLPASASSRVLQSTFFALGDTRTPARVAALRVVLGAVVAVPAMIAFDRLPVAQLPNGAELGDSALRLGAVGLALGATAAAWLERALLGRALRARVAEYAPASGETLRRARRRVAGVGDGGGARRAATRSPPDRARRSSLRRLRLRLPAVAARVRSAAAPAGAPPRPLGDPVRPARPSGPRPPPATPRNLVRFRP